jgi:uncharacterized NAD-dependent epimerase/dehydratase family protein
MTAPSGPLPEGRAIVYCEGAFGTPHGKTAHGLVRFTRRYTVLSVVDSGRAGQDAGEVIDGRPSGIPVLPDLDSALSAAADAATPATYLVVGLAPDGGRLSAAARKDVARAIEAGLNVDAGLHDFLSDDPELVALAERYGVVLRDVRRPPPRESLHFFSGVIEQVEAPRIALLGTDSAVGKRTTAWKLVQGLAEEGVRAELIGTGQTAWMQGVTYGIILDSLVNDFVTGEIEHAIWRAWTEGRPEVIVLEGQGSLLNPAYPGGFELLAAGRPDAVVLQHAPGRKEYDGFPGYPIHPLPRQIEAIELISDCPVVAITVNHENMTPDQTARACARIREIAGMPAFDVLLDGPGALTALLCDTLDLRRGVKA